MPFVAVTATFGFAVVCTMTVTVASAVAVTITVAFVVPKNKTSDSRHYRRWSLDPVRVRCTRNLSNFVFGGKAGHLH